MDVVKATRQSWYTQVTINFFDINRYRANLTVNANGKQLITNLRTSTVLKRTSVLSRCTSEAVEASIAEILTVDMFLGLVGEDELFDDSLVKHLMWQGRPPWATCTGMYGRKCRTSWPYCIMTTKNQQEYIICGIISSKIRRRSRPKKMHIIYLIFNSALFFLQVCWHNSGFVVGNSQNSVWRDWLSVQPEIVTASSMAGVSTLDLWKSVLMRYTCARNTVHGLVNELLRLKFSMELIEDHAIVPVVDVLESVQDRNDFLDQLQWRAIGKVAAKFDTIEYIANPASWPQKISKNASFVALFQPRSEGAAAACKKKMHMIYL